jgi:hypothetical protein
MLFPRAVGRGVSTSGGVSISGEVSTAGKVSNAEVVSTAGQVSTAAKRKKKKKTKKTTTPGLVVNGDRRHAGEQEAGVRRGSGGGQDPIPRGHAGKVSTAGESGWKHFIQGGMAGIVMIVLMNLWVLRLVAHRLWSRSEAVL